MTPSPQRAPWPLITVRLDEHGTAEVDRLGTTHTLTGDDTHAARQLVTDWIAQHVAGPATRPVAVTITDPDGTWHLTIDGDGTRRPSDHGEDRPHRATRKSRPGPPPPAPSPAAFTSEASPEPPLEPEAGSPAPEPTPGSVEPSTAPQTRAEARNVPAARPSFITAGRTVRPAEHGWRGSLNRMGFRLAPGADEFAMRQDVEAVSQHWGGPRTIAIVNGKGSASKTPTTACLAAVFARYGGAGVLAWDNNETRGSLAWRTEESAHKATVLDLLPRVDALMAATAQYAELAHYVHHQPADKYDVLWSDQSVAGDHIVTAEEVQTIHQLAARYYRMIVMDSGNSERADNWREMVYRADRLVVPCTNVEDTAEAGARLIEALTARSEHAAELARNAVVLVSQRTQGNDSNMNRIVRGFTDMGLAVATIPYDPALQTGVIRYDDLRPDTRRAWLRAAATIAQGL